MVEVLAPHGVQDSGVGAWSPSLDGDLGPQDRRGWVGPACALGTSRAFVFGAPSWAHWFTNHRRVGTTCLTSSIVVRTES